MPGPIIYGPEPPEPENMKWIILDWKKEKNMTMTMSCEHAGVHTEELCTKLSVLATTSKKKVTFADGLRLSINENTASSSSCSTTSLTASSSTTSFLSSSSSSTTSVGAGCEELISSHNNQPQHTWNSNKYNSNGNRQCQTDGFFGSSSCVASALSVSASKFLGTQ
uniref:Uncharacterized protein n=1 Tax=Caenorhabditis japonica TaxID=281687 RepID=A0A8R1I8G7_CAEJA